MSIWALEIEDHPSNQRMRERLDAAFLKLKMDFADLNDLEIQAFFAAAASGKFILAFGPKESIQLGETAFVVEGN